MQNNKRKHLNITEETLRNAENAMREASSTYLSVINSSSFQDFIKQSEEVGKIVANVASHMQPAIEQQKRYQEAYRFCQQVLPVNPADLKHTQRNGYSKTH